MATHHKQQNNDKLFSGFMGVLFGVFIHPIVDFSKILGSKEPITKRKYIWGNLVINFFCFVFTIYLLVVIANWHLFGHQLYGAYYVIAFIFFVLGISYFIGYLRRTYTKSHATSEINETLTDNYVNKKNSDYQSIISALKGLGYNSLDSKEGAEYSCTVYPKANLEQKLRNALTYFYNKKHGENAEIKETT
jgi:hypothetical protein